MRARAVLTDRKKGGAMNSEHSEDTIADDATFLAPALDRDDFVVVAHLNDLMARSEAYKQAADELVAAAIARCTNSNLAIAPILFNYRQAIELALKLIIGERYLAEHENIDIDDLFTHHLLKLWDPVRAWLVDRGSWDEWCEMIDCNIRLLDRIDPSSMSFRYVDERAHFAPDALQEIGRASLHHLRSVLGEVWDRLDAIHTMRYEEARAEAENFFLSYDGHADPSG